MGQLKRTRVFSGFYSGIILNGKHLECTWLDANVDAKDVTGFQAHFPEFKEQDGASKPDVD